MVPGRGGARRGGARSGASAEFLYADLVRQIPSIVCMHYDEGLHTTEHFRLIVGYDPTTDEVVYHEPAQDQGAYKRMKRTRMLRLWPLVYDPARWTLIRFRLDLDPAAERPPPTALVHGHTPAEYAQHVLALKERLGPGFTVVLEPPFVVAGNEREATVRERAEGIVTWTMSRLEADFFTVDPKLASSTCCSSRAGAATASRPSTSSTPRRPRPTATTPRRTAR